MWQHCCGIGFGPQQLLKLSHLTLPVVTLILQVSDKCCNTAAAVSCLSLWSLAVLRDAVSGAVMAQTINLQHEILFCRATSNITRTLGQFQTTSHMIQKENKFALKN